MNIEKKFYNALRDIFVGAKVEGKSGYINLMQIKSKYYEKGVFPKLQEDIEKAVEPFPEFKKELFLKLYTFFESYFSESGSIYFRYTPLYKNIYEKVYTDDKDVMLFWKTHMLYYVKTDRLFKNLEVEIDGYKFFFDVSSLEHKKANEKREIIFEFKGKRKDGVPVFNAFYSERGKKTKIDEILKALKKEGIRITEEILERAFKVFEKQSEVDYFINQNAKKFLREQFNIWFYQFIFSGESEWIEKRIKQLQVLKDIAFKIIDFISQFEDELVKIWNKPKFVLNSNYVITLDRILNSPFTKGVADRRSDRVFKKLPYNPTLKEKAKELRKAGNLSEVLLWNKLKKGQMLGYDFTRQQIIGDYIVDFHCPKLNLVIEIDGESHDFKGEYDEKRDEFLKSLGLEILRFKDIDVKKSLDNVLDQIYKWIKANTPSANADTPLQKGNLIEKIIKHKGMNKQIEEWKELGIVDDSFKKNEIIENDLTGKHLSKKYRHLPIDTKYFKDLELEILGLFDDLDNALDGWLIKSENYQALKTTLPKFKEQVQTIYIDPPFNKEQNADYLYSVKYKDASWITLLENRLKLAKDILNEKGSIFVRCDYNGNMYVRMFLNEVFGKENFRNEIVLRKVNYQGTNVQGRFNPAHDLLYFYNKQQSNSKFKIVYKERDREPNWVNAVSPKENKEQNTIYIAKRKFIAPKNHHWRFSQAKFNKLYIENRIRIKEDYEYIDVFGNKQTGIPQYLESELTPTDSNWTDISGYSFGWKFSTENSEILLKRIIESTSNEGDLVMDFFLGSGTTTAVAHKLGRKWLGVEMGEHFYSVVLPRMKKVLAYDKSGISKDKDVKEKYNKNNAGGFFKYYELEQYEDTLQKVKYENADLFDNPNENPYSQYVFMRDLKMLEALEVDYENNKVKVNLSKLYPNIDIPETLSNLLGKWIKRITSDYVEFEDGERIDLNSLDYKLIKPLIWW